VEWTLWKLDTVRIRVRVISSHPSCPVKFSASLKYFDLISI